MHSNSTGVRSISPPNQSHIHTTMGHNLRSLEMVSSNCGTTASTVEEDEEEEEEEEDVTLLADGCGGAVE